MNLIFPNGFERNFTVGFVRGLKANRVEVLVAADDETAPALQAARIACVNVRGSMAQNRSRWRKVFNMLRYYARLLRLLREHRGGVMHFTGIFQNRRVLFEGPLLAACLRLAAGRYIHTVHNVLPHGKVGSPLFRRVYGLIYRLPHVLLVHTRRARQQLVEEFGVPPEKIVVTSIGLNEEMPFTTLTPAEARHRLGLEPDARAVLFFGKIDEYKGLDVLLDAFDRLDLPVARLVIAGEFRNDACREVILRQLEKLRRRADVRLHERFIPNEEAEVFFKGCDVLCLPYRHIYQSGLIFLGPRFGLPMVTTDAGSLREFVQDGGLGMVSRTNDAAGIATALKTFFAHPDRFPRKEVAAAARKYRWAEVCRQLSPLYAPPSAAHPASQAATDFSVPSAGNPRP